jgi:uncharacterized protein (TIGR04255 family)
MNLPLSISPCPIVEAIAEVRFETSVPEDAIFGLVYQTLKEDFPKVETLPIASLPAELRKSDQNLALQPLHRLEGKDLRVLVGTHSVAVGVREGYPGWVAVSERLNSTFARIESTGLILKPVRFGLRYINFFLGDVFPNLALSITINNEPLTGAGTHFKTVIRMHDCSLLVQVGKDIMITGQKQVGSVVDIDSFVVAPDCSEGFKVSLARFLENAHTAEKELFFNLLKREFLETLNPIYPNA